MLFPLASGVELLVAATAWWCCPPQTRSLITYIKRTYHPFLLREPKLWGEAAGSTAAGATWAYDDPQWAGTSRSQPMAGCMVLVAALDKLPAAVAAAAEHLRAMEAAGGCGTLHVAITGRWRLSCAGVDGAALGAGGRVER